ncbi:MAG: rRNA ((1518)-N(6)/adenine(1519)-N(6))-dimethyltransferase [Firmicutes bacterium]|nr:rRNA ((1518)-N(6)/adenine(1519)-N(6))-dimethyltransferase [Bacillota bacterium]
MDLCNLAEIKVLLRRHGFQFSKSMGQNFLIEGWVPEQTAQAAGGRPGMAVLEIGPGIGPLTRALSDRFEKVVAVELDRSLLPVLKETVGDLKNVEIVPGDALKLDLRQLCESRGAELTWVVCANLPYNITSPIITALIEASCFSSITVMIQREVALRICGAPGTADYGAFSVFCQYHARCEHLFDVEPVCFYPPPKVTSAVVRLTLHSAPPPGVGNEDFFFRVVRAAFAQRRKTLVNGLHAAFGAKYSKEQLGELLESCGLSKTIRGECLGIPEFAQLAEKLQKGL